MDQLTRGLFGEFRRKDALKRHLRYMSCYCLLQKWTSFLHMRFPRIRFIIVTIWRNKFYSILGNRQLSLNRVKFYRMTI